MCLLIFRIIENRQASFRDVLQGTVLFCRDKGNGTASKNQISDSIPERSLEGDDIQLFTKMLQKKLA